MTRISVAGKVCARTLSIAAARNCSQLKTWITTLMVARPVMAKEVGGLRRRVFSCPCLPRGYTSELFGQGGRASENLRRPTRAFAKSCLAQMPAAFLRARLERSGFQFSRKFAARESRALAGLRR